jgi:hypothetical protein
MHRGSRAKLPVAAIRAVDDMRHSAAKDRDFKTVRPNQGTLTDAQTLLRGTPTNRFSLCRSGIPLRNDQSGGE